ncbi:unnamed protein product [Mytilus edulis]|uniref:Transcriptional coactivator p15 (PC4) C-terminal domain-containing protein n=1 Tax=Mytilus edulis TaxID=6550 RepID=A0A8S3QRE2_MYTED|nr:unnamed protein product [Mytilus edulis]
MFLLDGQHIFTHKNDKIRDPVSIAMLSVNVLIILDRNGALHALSNDGKKQATLLKKFEKVVDPWDMWVSTDDNTVYIAGGENHLRGVDGNTLAELVDGFSGIPPSDKSRLLTDASSAPSIGRRKSGSKLEIPYEGSEADGDYELDDNTFDLTNLVCCSVTKVQTNLHVSIRKYFIPRGRTCAKPTKYGISLNCEQWNKLELQVDDINSAIATTQKTLKDKEKEKDKKDCKDKNKLPGKEEFPDWILFSLSWKRRVGVFASGEVVVVDIREFSEEKAFSESDRGIRLKPDQWKQLQENINNINKSLRKLS